MAETGTFARILERAAKRKGGLAALEKQIAKPLGDKKLAAIADDRWLSGLSKAIFQFGFNWQVVETKWPGFEAAFDGFDLRRCAYLDDEALDRLLKDARIIRNPPKVRSVQANAAFFLKLATAHGSVGAFVAGFPRERYSELVQALVAGGDRVGLRTAQYFLRSMGKDSFILSDDVVTALKREGVVAKGVTGKADQARVQAAFDRWAAESGKPLTYISRVLAMSVGA